MSKPKYKQGKRICSMADFDQSECLYFKVKFGRNFRTRHRSFLISWQYRTLLNFIQNGWVFEAIQFPMAIDVVVCCDMFFESALVAKKLERYGYKMMNGEESPLEWLKEEFSGQDGLNFILYSDKTVAWCGDIYLLGAKGYYEIPAKTFLGW